MPNDVLNDRLELRITPDFRRLLNRVKRRTRAVSYAEVVRNALKAYDQSTSKKETA